MSSVDKPSMEGYLEKHSTGVSRLLGKTRFWCTLQGSCLVYCKESKRSSVVESLLLGDAQMVRKTSSDRLGTQFEIVMKKQRTHVFTAASTEECSNWVKHLQQAMIHNEPGSRRSEFRRQPASDSGYEEIAINADCTTSLVGSNSLKKQISVPQSGVYAEVVDAVRPRSAGFLGKMYNSSAGEYAEVADVVNLDAADKSDKTESVVYRENSLYIGNREREEIQKTLNQEDNDIQDIAGGYTTFDNCTDMLKEEAAAGDHKEEDPKTIPVYAKVNKQKNLSNQVPPPREDQMEDTEQESLYENYGVEVREGFAIENLDAELNRLPESSVPPVWVSFTADDMKPVEDLKEFLANNRQLCRPSYTRLVDDHDPVVKIKQLIQEIG